MVNLNVGVDNYWLLPLRIKKSHDMPLQSQVDLDPCRDLDLPAPSRQILPYTAAAAIALHFIFHYAVNKGPRYDS